LSGKASKPGEIIMADNDEAPVRANGSASQATAAPRRRAAAAASGTRRTRSAALKVDADSIEGQVAQLQQDLKSITTTLGRMGQTAGSELKSTARARADDLAARGQSALDTAQDEFGAFERQIKDTIREKPLTAVAGAVALGFLIAVITR
jgi:ElaB/YqjD/DUF883 family membrane-anchored ribosome-binding protein